MVEGTRFRGCSPRSPNLESHSRYDSQLRAFEVRLGRVGLEPGRTPRLRCRASQEVAPGGGDQAQPRTGPIRNSVEDRASSSSVWTKPKRPAMAIQPASSRRPELPPPPLAPPALPPAVRSGSPDRRRPLPTATCARSEGRPAVLRGFRNFDKRFQAARSQVRSSEKPTAELHPKPPPEPAVPWPLPHSRALDRAASCQRNRPLRVPGKRPLGVRRKGKIRSYVEKILPKEGKYYTLWSESGVPRSLSRLDSAGTIRTGLGTGSRFAPGAAQSRAGR